MKSYAVSLAIGLLVGVIYAMVKVKSPAPPVIALIGLFGMLIGEQVVPLAGRYIFKTAIATDTSSGQQE